VALHHIVVLSPRVSIVSDEVVLSRKVVLSRQALFRVPQVVSLRTSGGSGHHRNLGTVNRSGVVRAFIWCVLNYKSFNNIARLSCRGILMPKVKAVVWNMLKALGGSDNA